jgi:hypothetical protein
MGTSSTVNLLKDGKVHQICCNFDGYPSGVGEVLLHHYTDVNYIQQLITYGDALSIGKFLEPTGIHEEGNWQEDVCKFYARDLGADLNIRTYDSIVQIGTTEHERYMSYMYLYIDQWYVRGVISDDDPTVDHNKWYKLTDSIIDWCHKCIYGTEPNNFPHDAFMGGTWIVRNDFGNLQVIDQKTNGNTFMADIVCNEYRNTQQHEAEWLLQESNAQLIAAAPDLLAVCVRLRESVSYWSDYDVPIGIVEQLNAAIEKATGCKFNEGY